MVQNSKNKVIWERPAMVALVIADGWGIAPPGEGNAITQARTPVMDRLTAEYPHTLLSASGLDVGLPAGQMGNSEVGHMNMGAGRVVYQDLTRISRMIATGRFYENPVLLDALARVKAAGGTLHLMGLFSTGGVHSHLDHLKALVKLAHQQGMGAVHVHAFLDGRDTSPTSGLGYLEDFCAFIKEMPEVRVATVMGRFYAMDRDQRWDRIARAYQALVQGEGRQAADCREAVRQAYADGETDEFVTPTIIGGAPPIADGDGVIFFNFRADRAREITRALTAADFTGFDRKVVRRLSAYVCFTEYDASFRLPVAFPPEELEHVLGEEIATAGRRQVRIAETEKYAHVTFFFNGGREEPFAGEERRLVPSPQEVRTYDEKPEMSAAGVADEAVNSAAAGDYGLLVVNFANCDMVGHTGNVEAAVRACETVDAAIGRVVAAVTAAGGVAIVTADHGNAECMLTPDGQPMTAHTTNPVPLILVGEGWQSRRLRENGILADIAPTILTIMGLPVPAAMTGKMLLAGG
jgi:2,3-bisphosphoglycerate-independent phosphoglycerate mutase